MKKKASNKDTVLISRKEYDELLKLKEEFIIFKNDHSRLQYDYEYAKFQLGELRRMLFGHKSERYVSSQQDTQLDLFVPQEIEKEPEAAPTKEIVTYERTKEHKKNKPVRSALPAHLKRVEEVIEPDPIPEGAQKIGEAVTELLEYTPAEVYVRRIVRPKYVVPGSEGEGCVKVAEMPCLPLPRSNAGASLLAHICTSKFVDHLPFYRQVQIFKRDGIIVAESTLKGWFAAICHLLLPLYQALIKEIIASNYLQVDETPIAVLTVDKPGSTHQGYIWVCYSPLDGLVCFYYSKSRAGETVANFLGDDYRGALQTDAYVGYNQYKEKEGIQLLSCAAHARRRFEHAKENSPSRSREALEFFKKLYKVEEKARQGGLSHEQRKALRQEEALPVMEEFKQWLEKQRGEVLPRSPIGEAVSYTLNIWDRLERYLSDGRFEIDNNLIENSIRPVALGRKNYLFAGSHEGAQYNAMMYTFFACCKIAGIHPETWLKKVLESILQHPANRLTELLPNQMSWKSSKE